MAFRWTRAFMHFMLPNFLYYLNEHNEIVGRAAACIPKGLTLMATVQAMYEQKKKN